MQSPQDMRHTTDVPALAAVTATRDASAATVDMPTGIAVGVGAVTVVVAATVAALLPASADAVRLGVMALALGTFAAATVDPPAVAGVTELGWLVFYGFLVNRFSDLTWTGRVDELRLGVLVAAAVAGLAVGGLLRWAEGRRRDAELQALVTGAADPEVGMTEGEGHDAGSGVRAVDDRVVSWARPDGACGEQAVSARSEPSEPGSRERRVTR
jgi:hypothetical protein